MLDTLVCKANEFQMPVWAASLDMRKAFDTIEHGPLLNALRQQGEEYVELICVLYQAQTVSVNGSRSFRFARGVKQGDVLSPLLFNAALEIAFREWKQELKSHGWQLQSGHERLTNIRFADGMLVLHKTEPELCDMLDVLLQKLKKVGLSLNASKTKIVTADEQRFRTQCSSVARVGAPYIHIPGPDETHKYLGRRVCFAPVKKTDEEIKNRMASAWAQYQTPSHFHKQER